MIKTTNESGEFELAPIGYDPKRSLLLAEVSALTYQQLQKSQADSQYDGSIAPPPGYRQTAVFKAPEIHFDHKQSPGCKPDHLHLSAFDPEKIVLTDLKALEDLVKCVNKVFFGFALEATDGSGNCIIALRGTQYPYEWAMDASFVQVPIPLVWFEDHKLKMAKAHFGFLFLHAFLKEQIIKAAAGFTNPKTCYVTGHSLGAALAVLAALTLGTKTFKNGGIEGKVRMYNYAGPRVGDPAFADAYNHFIPESYRVVNLADVVPIVPPTEILKYHYRHIGGPSQEWSYINQTGDIVANHSVDGYIQALKEPGRVNNQSKNGLALSEIAAASDPV